MNYLVRYALWAGLVLAVPVSAQQIGDTGKPQKGGREEVICERQEVTGSRLATRKVCMTRAEWDDQKRSDRDAVDKAQRNVPAMRP
ncbi:hypothetical protein [Flavisphingomonas formosensis]|uniref:hypothetical protein n=1 Tax=Flavisphingomonas formosensis TaxID=861534 RepID=UPI0012F7ACC6|nr:hypothetical protein [Sphingomonas formosensis]